MECYQKTKQMAKRRAPIYSVVTEILINKLKFQNRIRVH